jgi:hypothetical protein
MQGCKSCIKKKKTKTRPYKVTQILEQKGPMVPLSCGHCQSPTQDACRTTPSFPHPEQPDLLGACSILTSEHLVPIGCGGGKFPYSFYKGIFKIVFLCAWDLFFAFWCGCCISKAHLRNTDLSCCFLLYGFVKAALLKGDSTGEGVRNRADPNSFLTHQEPPHKASCLCLFSAPTGRYPVSLQSICNPAVTWDQLIWKGSTLWSVSTARKEGRQARSV